MKRFVIINGTNVFIIEKESMTEARHYAINFMDHSKETIVRECSKLTDYTHIYENIPVN